MKKEERFFLLLLCANFVLSCGYAAFWIFYRLPRQRKAGQSGENAKTILLRALLMALCPVVGPLYVGSSFLLEHTPLFRNIDLSDVVFQKKKARTYAVVDENRERNLAPMEETLEVGDKPRMRTLMLNVLHSDLEESLGSIMLALNSTDSETSHYAASVLHDELNGFRIKVQQLYEEIRREPETECELESMLFDYMGRILPQKVFSDLEQKKYVQIFEAAAERLYQKDAAQITQQRYELLCAQLRECGMTALAEKWTQRLTRQYPGELAAYTSQLKLYFMENDKERFFKVLEELKRSDVTVDRETLELLRIFQ